ncbi:hypothetical protein [Polyangium spumosum]|uniref:MAM domain-containing protein n=1 Tax=Polyangium spumosum TaxID=889282 RepID=A0A6N7PT30_9BACT|nr:hypothetical protein [Polyangium spumosum]MRG95133.1 hypothetical protein [Polyangium spumosum]
MREWMNWGRILAASVCVVATACARPSFDVTRGQTEAEGEGEGEGEGGAGGGESTLGATSCPADCSLVDTPPCLVSVCDEEAGRCAVIPRQAGTSCEDGFFCTVGDTCQSGVCVGGVQNDCGLKAATCSVVTCNEATASCEEGPALDGAPCVSSDACTVSSSCKGGACVGSPKSCHFAPVPDDCHVAVCDPQTGACEPVPGNEGLACEQGGDPCLTGKTCAAGACQGGGPKDCTSAGDDCNRGVCEAATGACVGAPKNEGGACSEVADECNTGMCDASGVCQRVPTPGVACASAANDCNVGQCDATGVCVAVPVNEGGACEDGNACTLGETCSAGSCTGGKAEGYVVYLHETFADNAAGWTLEGEWQIGPAKASPGNASHGAEDPDTDRTSTADNGIAGVNIGGYAAEAVHPPEYLVSPVLDTSGTGSLWLSFYRWLNSDYGPYMTNTVDVFDGNAWVNVWNSGGPPALKDAAWTLVTYDLTAYRNPQMRVRFGFEVGNGGVFTVSGWNLDDVTIANAVCEIADTPAPEPSSEPSSAY